MKSDPVSVAGLSGNFYNSISIIYAERIKAFPLNKDLTGYFDKVLWKAFMQH